MPIPKHLNEQSLGYALHTNRELGMMLKGQKPLAMFSDRYGRFPEVVIRYLRLFDRYVERGLLIKREYVELRQLASSRYVHVVLYAAPREQWRIEAMQALRWRGDWGSGECEKAEGKLLGYTDEQNDLWLARPKVPPPK